MVPENAFLLQGSGKHDQFGKGFRGLPVVKITCPGGRWEALRKVVVAMQYTFTLH